MFRKRLLTVSLVWVRHGNGACWASELYFWKAVCLTARKMQIFSGGRFYNLWRLFSRLSGISWWLCEWLLWTIACITVLVQEEPLSPDISKWKCVEISGFSNLHRKSRCLRQGFHTTVEDLLLWTRAAPALVVGSDLTDLLSRNQSLSVWDPDSTHLFLGAVEMWVFPTCVYHCAFLFWRRILIGFSGDRMLLAWYFFSAILERTRKVQCVL